MGHTVGVSLPVLIPTLKKCLPSMNLHQFQQKFVYIQNILQLNTVTLFLYFYIHDFKLQLPDL